MMPVIDLIAEEARANRTVTITAREADGSIETREIEPYSLRPAAAGLGTLLFGYCLVRQAIRSWNVDNILDVLPTGAYFEPRWPVEL